VLFLKKNAAEEAVEEELLPSEELFTTVLLGQDDNTAATSCFHVYSSFLSCYGQIFIPKGRIQ